MKNIFILLFAFLFLRNTDARAQACDVNITGVTFSDCQYVLGISYVTVQFTVEWTNAPAGETIDLSVSGIPFVAPIDPSVVTSPVTISTVPIQADGSVATISAAFSTTTTCSDVVNYTLPSGCTPVDVCDFALQNHTCVVSISSGNFYQVLFSWSQNYSSDFSVFVDGHHISTEAFTTSPQDVIITAPAYSPDSAVITVADTAFADLNIYIIAYDPVVDYNLSSILGGADQCDEFIVIANHTLLPFDISGYTIYNQSTLGSTPIHTFPAGSIINPEGGICVFTGSTPTFPIPFPFDIVFQSMSTTPPCATGAWNDTGDNAYLFNPSGEMVDFGTFTPDAAGIDTLNPDTMICSASLTLVYIDSCGFELGECLDGAWPTFVFYTDVNSNGIQDAGEPTYTSSVSTTLTGIGTTYSGSLLSGDSIQVACGVYDITFIPMLADDYITTTTPITATISEANPGTYYIGVSTILPICLMDFKTTIANEDVRLYWSTANEMNNESFIIERSNDGIHYMKIGTVPAVINSKTISYYNMLDEDPAMGKNYYRLKSLSTTGEEKIEAVRMVEFEYKNSVDIYPNPIEDILHVKIPTTQKVTLTIQDTQGKIVYQNVLQSSTSIDMKEFSKGIYFISYNDGSENIRKIFVKI